ncbi:MBL fold metallo-hydrolase [Dehalogenimonas etheniformans]|uniref:MBL fold metallo-hydrolase n=1 Tax=Dehalogenimonas etheniformans TaxID=1536648 RepID=A0A2P5P982_9CHLR|nr:MBL fold metallo-hydrolase [Dehalogenimonas etheniformans]PPD58861.1 MBL fold metallo-hydrolase [Dehalogenimonas etheniformans]QNT76371.1 MBL fold metallo-hydrolase [Dehalogenimonas etheniformans]
MIIERLVVGPIEANCYIVGDEKSKEGMVIDPGDDPEDIMLRVHHLGLKITHIILTHSHFDHVAGTTAVKKATGARLAVHEADSSSLNNSMLARLAGCTHQPVPEPDLLLKGWEDLSLGELHFTVLNVPGHTPGGIALYGQDVVFTGDTLFQGSIGRTDLPGGEYDQIIDSINRRLMILDDAVKVYPGHGEPTTIGFERENNPFLVNPPRKQC